MYQSPKMESPIQKLNKNKTFENVRDSQIIVESDPFIFDEAQQGYNPHLKQNDKNSKIIKLIIYKNEVLEY